MHVVNTRYVRRSCPSQQNSADKQQTKMKKTLCKLCNCVINRLYTIYLFIHLDLFSSVFISLSGDSEVCSALKYTENKHITIQNLNICSLFLHFSSTTYSQKCAALSACLPTIIIVSLTSTAVICTILYKGMVRASFSFVKIYVGFFFNLQLIDGQFIVYSSYVVFVQT